jgi:Ca2+-binding EF-hand superfamily protein
MPSRSKSPARARKRKTEPPSNKAPEKLRVFRELDTNHNGTLSIDEVEAALVHLGLSAAELQRMFDEADADGSGEIDFDEYASIVESSKEWGIINAKTNAEVARTS